MKKILLLITLLVAGNAYGATRWCQPDNEKPKQAFDYFVGGDNETCYVILTPEAKEALKKMLSRSNEDTLITDVIRRVSKNVRTEAGREALKALQEMVDNDSELPAGVVKEGVFGDPKKTRKAQTQPGRQS